MRRVLPLLMLLGAVTAGCADQGADEAEASGPEAVDSEELEARRRGGRPPKDRGKSDGGAALDSGVARRPVYFAAAEIGPKSGNTTLRGTAFFAKHKGGVQLTLWVTGAPPGKHGAHVHAVGDCSADDASSAGGHWNPTDAMHGAPSPEAHLGDLGSITIGQSGRGVLKIENPLWTLGDGAPTDVLNHAIIIHADADDLMTQPTGNAGGRIGCGVIEAD